jgi:hypothetical protein
MLLKKLVSLYSRLWIGAKTDQKLQRYVAGEFHFMTAFRKLVSLYFNFKDIVVRHC